MVIKIPAVIVKFTRNSLLTHKVVQTVVSILKIKKIINNNNTDTGTSHRGCCKWQVGTVGTQLGIQFISVRGDVERSPTKNDFLPTLSQSTPITDKKCKIQYRIG